MTSSCEDGLNVRWGEGNGPAATISLGRYSSGSINVTIYAADGGVIGKAPVYPGQEVVIPGGRGYPAKITVERQ